MKDEIKYAVFQAEEGIMLSVIRDLTTLMVVSLLVYVSRDSNFWTLITGLMFITWVVSKILSITKSGTRRFKTKAELLSWVTALPDDNTDK